MATDIGPVQVTSSDIGPVDNNASVGGYTPDLGSDGWTTIPEPTTGRKVYVSSSSGSDSNDGLSEGAPKETIAAGKALIRDGYDDHLLFKRGDTFSTGSIGNITFSGVSASAPIVIGSYGSGDLPILNGGAAHTLGGGNTVQSNIWICDINFVAPSLDYGTAIGLVAGGSNWRIEGCIISGWTLGIDFAGSVGRYDNVTIHRCVVYECSQDEANGHAQGMLISECDNVSISECYFDHNGWHATEPGHEKTIFNHNMYLQGDCTELSVTKTWMSRASSHGIQLRSGGVMDDNTGYKNPIHFLNSDDQVTALATTRRNVCIDGDDTSVTYTRGWCFSLAFDNEMDASYNIAAHQVTGTNARGMEFGSSSQANCAGGKVKGNVQYKWNSPLLLKSDLDEVVFANNDVHVTSGVAISSYPDNTDECSGNRYYTSESDGSRLSYNGSTVTDASWKTSMSDSGSTYTDLSAVYTDPEKDMDDYAVSIGLADADALLTQIRTQRKGNWDLNLTPDRINAYFRANFDMRPAPSSFTATKDSLDVDLEWDAIPEASGYIIERRTDGGSWEQIGSA